MKKLLFFLFIAALATSCNNKGNFSCYCVGPDGSVIAEYKYTGYQETQRTATEKCDAAANAFNGSNRGTGTQCALR